MECLIGENSVLDQGPRELAMYYNGGIVLVHPLKLNVCMCADWLTNSRGFYSSRDKIRALQSPLKITKLTI